MTIVQSFGIALGALRLNALRSFLTMLGIIIGVAAVIIMVSVSSGAQQLIEDQINSLGTNVLVIRPGSSWYGGRRGAAGSDAPFTEDDLTALIARCPFIVAASGDLRVAAPVIARGRNWSTSINGVHAQYPEVRDWRLAAGRGFTERDVRAAAKVAILGQSVVAELFEGSPALGAQIRIKNVPFTVIGVLEEKGRTSFGTDQDDVVQVPMSTMRLRIGGRSSRITAEEIGTLMVKIARDMDMTEAEQRIETILRERRRIAPGAEDDFTVGNIAEFIRTRTATQSTLSVLLASTALIALVVGGIGIMNIMLVSVTERTREIGIRVAVGARRRDILTQFLVEAVTLCLIGSVFGVLLGVIATHLIARIGVWPVLITAPTIVAAVAAAAAVGVFFGFYPARKAARLHPVDALRYE
jgi:putative ABC transport system permease protein